MKLSVALAIHRFRMSATHVSAVFNPCLLVIVEPGLFDLVSLWCGNVCFHFPYLIRIRGVFCQLTL